MNNLQNCGNLLEYIQGDCDIQILRVYGYESKVADRCYYGSTEWEPEDESEEAVNKLFSLVKENILGKWWENKCVVEIYIGSWHLFLGYWDSYQTIGFGVIPNWYPPKGNRSDWGHYEPINISRK